MTPSRQYQSLGAADDYLDADGVDTLTFAQAQEKAAAFFTKCQQARGVRREPVTVRKAADHYMDAYRAKGGKAERDTQTTINAHILPSLGDILVADLAPGTISKWRDKLATAPARMRAGPRTIERKVRFATDADAKRGRRATANRILTVLKAILNKAFADGLVDSDDAWRRVKPFPHVDAPKIQYLSQDEARRLVNACPVDFRRLVSAALLTGCRYGELANLRAADFDAIAKIAHVREPKARKPRVAHLTNEGVTLLKGLAAGKARDSLLLVREDGNAWGKGHQVRRLTDACKAADIAPAISFHIIRHTFASRLAMAEVPMKVIADCLGNSEAICAKHYAHLAPSYVGDRMRKGFGELGIVPESNVATLTDSA
jgi:integrase